MRIKMGTSVPKKGTTVHPDAGQMVYRETVAKALRSELGPTHQAIKTAMRWTGASERTAKYWLSGERGPSGEHLIRLAMHSDAVLLMILTLAERLSDKRQRCIDCRERMLVLKNLGSVAPNGSSGP